MYLSMAEDVLTAYDSRKRRESSTEKRGSKWTENHHFEISRYKEKEAELVTTCLIILNIKYRGFLE